MGGSGIKKKKLIKKTNYKITILLNFVVKLIGLTSTESV